MDNKNKDNKKQDETKSANGGNNQDKVSGNENTGNDGEGKAKEDATDKIKPVSVFATAGPKISFPVIFLPGENDETCRSGGATENLAFVTKVTDADTINLQAVVDGPPMQWRVDVQHQSKAAKGADAWKMLDEETIERS